MQMQVPDLGAVLNEYMERRAALDRFGIYFIRDITDEEAEAFSKTIFLMGGQRRGFPDSAITVFINSGGGSVGAGLAMMEMIFKIKRDFGIRVNTVVTGYAYSMGAIVFQAGDKRSMGYLSTLMLHSPSWFVSGEEHKIFKDLDKLATNYRHVLSELLYRRSGKHNAAWWKRFVYSGRDRFLAPRECLDLGLTDEVCDFDACYFGLPGSKPAPAASPHISSP